MSDIIHYLEPVESTWNPIYGISNEDSLGGQTIFFDGNIKTFNESDYEIVIIGVPEDRNSCDKNSCSKAPYIIRNNLYGLRRIKGQQLIDTGNIKGNTVKDRYSALQEVSDWFLKKNKKIIVLGGTQDLTIPLYKALTNVKNRVIVTACDAMIDLDIEGDDFSSRAWINKLFSEKKESLSDLTLLGIQNYLVSERLENIINERFYDIMRLSEIRGDGIKNAEIPLRDSDLFSFDFRSIKEKHSFAGNIASSHGLEPYEACKLCHYAGMSSKLSILGLFEATMNENEESLSNAALSAQMIWHFIDGISERFSDFPSYENNRYKRYVVFLDAADIEIQFYNNETNGRWWFEIPSVKVENKIFSCDHNDYLKAMGNEIPDKLWRLFMRYGK